MTTLTERQIREKNYYAQYAQKFDHNQEIDLTPILGPLYEIERRPWNSYWRTYEIPVDHIRNHKGDYELKLLDFGCGPGDNALRFSKAGFYVTGFDICEENIKNCKQLFLNNQCEARGDFLVSQAEALPFSDQSFDVVIGIDILHHVVIPDALSEVKRVLKANGIAVFREPIEVPLFDKIRNTKFMRFLFPNSVSLEAHITQDEKKLCARDLKMISDLFPDSTIERSLIFSRFDKFLRSKKNKSPSVLEKIDHLLVKFLPFLSDLGGAAVIVIKK